jgi:quercetin dioxygenase-like cupin family protein
MNEREFEAGLKADGYQEIEWQELAPRPGKGKHRHHFAIRGLVLSGTFHVTQNSDPATYGAGQIFAVAEGELHDECIGPEGARVLVGRKFSETKPAAVNDG